MPLHIHPTAPIAPSCLLPGDPGRALLLAQDLLEKPVMSNHNRGLWGYYGETLSGGVPMTIQSSGIGGPSTAVVLRELFELGVRSVVRVGTCGALEPSLRAGDVLVVSGAIAEDGTSRAIGASGIVEPEPRLTAALHAAAGEEAALGVVVTTDLFYSDGASDADGAPDGRGRAWAAAGAVAVEMEAATVFSLAARLGISAGCILTPSDELYGDGRRRLGETEIAEAGLRIGRIAAAALA